ncbi:MULTISPECIES: hypothetical protein [Kribbella]|uniref:Uncharacterized protein n=2 Tax=Kribbella TaxID=182639 RepID=A0A4R0IDI1_9ACTN|nr:MULTISPECIES: hypothetical protein [Kribbella]TCC30509.1 hypothetical protein E0H50_24180 [Kribbella sindirgiensis]TCC33217.1 hypothetical protein E0H92_34295 [Kribbella speibonae]
MIQLDDATRRQATELVQVCELWCQQWRELSADQASEPVDNITYDMIARYMPLALQLLPDSPLVLAIDNMSESVPAFDDKKSRSPLTIRRAREHLSAIAIAIKGAYALDRRSPSLGTFEPRYGQVTAPLTKSAESPSRHGKPNTKQ